MKLGVLFSGGKDSIYSAWLMKKSGHELSCLISVWSKNTDSYMFHTPAIELTKKQSELMDIPIVVQETIGEKEVELIDLEKAICLAIKEYNIEGIVSGAVKSNYQLSRIEKICDKLKIKCFSPLWQKDQIELLNDLIENKFEILISAVAGYPLDDKWIGRKIDNKFIQKIKIISKKYGINSAGEGGEYESLVVNCPLFSKKLDIKLENIFGGKNSFRGEFMYYG